MTKRLVKIEQPVKLDIEVIFKKKWDNEDPSWDAYYKYDHGIHRLVFKDRHPHLSLIAHEATHLAVAQMRLSKLSLKSDYAEEIMAEIMSEVVTELYTESLK